MRIYIASHSAEEARAFAFALRGMGYKVASTWHEIEEKLIPHTQLNQEQKEAIARRDFSDIYNSDVLIIMSGDEKYSGGKFVEAGYAMALNIPVIVYGRYENVMVSLCPRVDKEDYGELSDQIGQCIYDKYYIAGQSLLQE